MDFESCFKVYNVAVIHLIGIKVGQMMAVDL